MCSTEYNHPCTVHAKVYGSYGNTAAEDITEFSLDLVSPIEYLFRKFSANEFGKLVPNTVNVLNYQTHVRTCILEYMCKL